MSRPHGRGCGGDRRAGLQGAPQGAHGTYLPAVVTKLVNRGYQPHLEDFLLRINFNNYYQDA